MKSVESLTDLLRVLGDPTRLRLLTALNQGELSVREITQVTGLSQPRVSRHLKLLCEARILKRTRDQNEVYYRTTIDDDRRALVHLAHAVLDAAVVQHALRDGRLAGVDVRDDAEVAHPG